MSSRRARTYPAGVAASVVLAMALWAQPAIAAGGELDATFGAGGVLSTDFGGTYDWAYAAAVQPDGKIVAGGTSFPDAVVLRPNADFILARFTPDGAPDSAFGIGGATTTDFGKESWDDARALALQPDGGIILGGSTNSGNSPGVLFGADQLGLARYTPQGMLDGSFGNGGTVTVDGGTMVEAVRALALRPDGTIVAAGFVNGEHRDRAALNPGS